MARQKQIKFAELKTFSNYYDGSTSNRANWGKLVFNNEHPLVLELGCGKGEYTNDMGRRFPGRNFIGVDLKAVRLWAGAKKAMEADLQNVAFLQINIDSINDYFDEEEVAEIWIPFPDPYPRPCKWKKRLMSSVFLNRYRKILQKQGKLYFKTDNHDLYKFALAGLKETDFEIIASTEDLYKSAFLDEQNSVRTYFESIFLEQEKAIKYIAAVKKT